MKGRRLDLSAVDCILEFREIPVPKSEKFSYNFFQALEIFSPFRSFSPLNLNNNQLNLNLVNILCHPPHEMLLLLGVSKTFSTERIFKIYVKFWPRIFL